MERKYLYYSFQSASESEPGSVAAMGFCIPYPQGSESVLPIEVPYVAEYPYDTSLPNLFENFAHEHRFDSYDRPPDELAALMQSWLFFGLISEMCGRDIDHILFVRTRVHAGKEFRFIDSRLDEVLQELVINRFDAVVKQPKHRADSTWSALRRVIQSAERNAWVFDNVSWKCHLIARPYVIELQCSQLRKRE